MQKYLIPKISFKDLLLILKFSLLGAAIAACYGIVHDQITYSISPEYYTKLKFSQFAYADFGLGDRFFAAIIGFLASWWFGFFSAWFYCRILLNRGIENNLLSKHLRAFLFIFAYAFLAALCGFLMGQFHSGNYKDWMPVCRQLKINDIPSFVQVAYIHNGSYAGSFFGLILQIVFIFKKRTLDD